MMGKRRIYRVIFYTLIILMIYSISAGAGSLWDDENANIYKSKEMEYESGDVITVLIEESSDAVQSSNTDISQESNADVGGSGFLDFLSVFGFEYSDSDSSDGQTERSGSITADITTLIVDVYDNGNFKIEGTKTIKINGEKQIITLSGIIRPQDIAEDNSISSKKIADASIDVEGRGVIAAKEEPNIFQKILNWIF
ncbi:MAG: flagellar basal body L-ring protein FlgH [Halanaerobiales bacterium]